MTTAMNLIAGELGKLRRLHLWVLFAGIPGLSVVLGALNYRANAGVLTSGWRSLWSQFGLFYGLFFMTVGIAALASAMWRVERRSGGWNRLMGSPVRVGALLAAKVAALSVLVAAMQLVFVGLGFVAGLTLGLRPDLPPALPLAALAAIVPGVAVAAWQSLVSMVVRNVALPVGIAGVATVLSFGLIASGSGLSSLLPPALLTRTISLGSSAIAGAGALTPAALAPLLAASLALTALGWGLAVLWVHRTDVRS